MKEKSYKRSKQISNIIVHIVLIPVLVMALKRAGIFEREHLAAV